MSTETHWVFRVNCAAVQFSRRQYRHFVLPVHAGDQLSLYERVTIFQSHWGGLIHFHSLCHFVFPLGQSWGTFLPWLGETRTQVCFATIIKRIPIDKHGTMGSSQLNPHPDRHQKMRALCVVVPFRNHFKGVDVSFDPEMCFDIIEYVNIVSSSFFMHNNEQN